MAFEVEITRTDGRRHKTLIWAENHNEVIRKIDKEYGKNARPVRIVQLEGRGILSRSLAWEAENKK